MHPTLHHGRTISLEPRAGKKLAEEHAKAAEAAVEERKGLRRGKSFSVSVTAQVSENVDE